MRRSSIPSLPNLLQQKIYKTGQTRGADDDEIYQNRVSRNSTVLIPYDYWQYWRRPENSPYEKNYIVLISPDRYFGVLDIESTLTNQGLVLGVNMLVYYESRSQWTDHNPEEFGWIPAEQRTIQLGGQYVARIPATTATNNGSKINRGFTATRKGAGIRAYEYASKRTIEDCRLQLEALFWKCHDADVVATMYGMTAAQASMRKSAKLAECQLLGLLDIARLTQARMLNAAGRTICPLCLEELSAQGFFSRMEQAEGRVVLDLTITQLNLFHIEELRLGEWNHRSYNLGWGHHHCNVVVKDVGIPITLAWMHSVLERNAADASIMIPATCL